VQPSSAKFIYDATPLGLHVAIHFPDSLLQTWVPGST